MARFSGVLLAMFLASGAAACFKGAEREKEAPPGNVGGLCLAPDGHCTEGMCNRDKNFCFDAANPCEGFYCGGEERGSCILDADLQPSCVCTAGYNNETFALYCCPDDGISDPNCAAPSSAAGEESSSG
jgi:hypothetical protein